MIDSIFGKLIKKEPTFAIVDMDGIRLKINISIATFEKLPVVGTVVELMTYLHVREDILDLYGFAKDIERDLFLKLIGVSGIGPRSAITILSGATPQEFKKRIISEDVKSLTVIPGIGPKTAKRIILELKEKFVDEDVDISNLVGVDKTSDKVKDVVQALLSLGYRRGQINEALKKLKDDNMLDGSIEELIKEALTKM
ncbi:MAG: Holliday junction branch migration protein RuvA [Planctomycetia bacterium]|nr:Holliday junction branch migration protein RuvA [Planctomycetia bacterium]